MRPGYAVPSCRNRRQAERSDRNRLPGLDGTPHRCISSWRFGIRTSLASPENAGKGPAGAHLEQRLDVPRNQKGSKTIVTVIVRVDFKGGRCPRHASPLRGSRCHGINPFWDRVVYQVMPPLQLSADQVAERVSGHRRVFSNPRPVLSMNGATALGRLAWAARGVPDANQLASSSLKTRDP